MSPFAFIAIGRGARSIENLQLTQEADNTAADTLCLVVVKLMVGCGYMIGHCSSNDTSLKPDFRPV